LIRVLVDGSTGMMAKGSMGKTVSMNVMHSSMSVTDQIYSRMKDEDIHTRISNLGANSKKPLNSKDEDLQVIQEFLEYREKNRTHKVKMRPS